ncbi:AAA family ATPase [Pseudorhodoferax sp. Leaf267]|uniref:ATP-binding protein n=1 Tax=Pseudorhodoferax sp. Leaf267 TaxID=1736316 RepID=UPI0006F7C57C|nr:AAA family ATPase [Pseudorhodoferax sp. Leaf267]KQP22689.1 hypothetical protein ASF43_01910 [Pseudorhodoferax sp. Leaf267]
MLDQGSTVDLPRKPLALLWMLAGRAGEVVTKDEMLARVWPDVVVSEGVLSTTLRELRVALGDDARAPRFIATAHRIGYRFIAPVAHRSPGNAGVVPQPPVERVAADAAPLAPPTMDALLVGRGAERVRLREAYRRAAAGQRQVLFIAGEAGIGKTRLVESFLAELAASPEASGDLVSHGQCIEHFGAGEPYLPLLDAVTALCRQRGGRPLVALLRRHAPAWAAQMPGLFGAEPPGPADTGAGAAQRMPRQMADVVDLAAADRTLVLVFEDMHWSDPSTVDWLAMLARRRERSRLLVIATCRPVELAVQGHPLQQVKRDLVARQMAQELVLGRLAAPEVRDYVRQRMQGRAAVPALAAAVFRRSQGHPLFMVHIADDLQRLPDGAGLSGEVPSGVGELIEAQAARLPAEQLRVLEAASVAGAEFATAAVAAALQMPAEQAEQVLETLARQGQFVEARGLATWRDGTVSGRYGFRHDLVRESLYRRLGSDRRMRLHAAIAARLARAYQGHSGDIAAELALHFENAHQPWEAAQHRIDAGDKALHRYAHPEALGHAAKGLALLAAAPADRPGRPLAELRLRLIEGAALLTVRGYGAPEVEATYTRALALGIELNDGAAIGPALSGLFNSYLTRGAFAQVQQIADQVLAQLRRQPDVVLAMLAHNVRGTAQLFVGGAAASLEHVDQTLALYDPQAHRHLAATYGEDPAIASHHYAALSRWVLGDADAAEHHLRAGSALAYRLEHAFGEAQMLWVESVIALDDGDLDRVERATRRLDAICVDCGYPLWQAGGQILRGAALAGRAQHEEGQRLTDTGLRAWREAGTLLTLPHALAVAARMHGMAGRLDVALAGVEEALAIATQTGEHWYTAELHRLHGELRLRARDEASARACFGQALQLAQGQRAALFEYRAAASLAALGAPGAGRVRPLRRNAG